MSSEYVLRESGYFKRSDDSGPYSIDSSGNATLLGSGGGAPASVNVSNFPATQPISAEALPLPAGAATAAGVSSLATNIGPATARPAVTNPAAAADVNQLLRGQLTVLASLVTAISGLQTELEAQSTLLQTIATNTTPATP